MTILQSGPSQLGSLLRPRNHIMLGEARWTGTSSLSPAVLPLNGTYGSGAGSAAGTCTVAARRISEAAGSSAGVGTATAVRAGWREAIATSESNQATWTDVAGDWTSVLTAWNSIPQTNAVGLVMLTRAGAAQSSGVATPSFVGIAISTQGAGVASGVATATAGGKAFKVAVASASGVATASAVMFQSFVSGVGLAVGANSPQWNSVAGNWNTYSEVWKIGAVGTGMRVQVGTAFGSSQAGARTPTVAKGEILGEGFGKMIPGGMIWVEAHSDSVTVVGAIGSKVPWGQLDVDTASWNKSAAEISTWQKGTVELTTWTRETSVSN